MKKINIANSGSSLVVVALTIATLAVIVGVTLDYSSNINRLVQRTTTLQTAVSAADATVEKLFTNWRAICRATPATPLATNAFASIPLPSSSDLNLPNSGNFSKAGANADLSDEYDANYSVSNVKIVAVDGTLQSLATAATAPPPAVGMAQTGVVNTTSASYNYVASADVTLPTLRGNVVAKVRRVFSKQQLSPWNWAIFYVDPLEIHPGAPMTVTGWVNTNSNLYTAHNTLTFADKVTYASDWFINFMPGDGQHPETPTNPSWLSNLPPARDLAMQPFGMDSTAIFSTTDTNPNNDSYHELIEVPTAGYTDPLVSSRYWDQASVIIKVDAGNNVTIGSPNSNGTITVFNSSNPLYQMFNGAITTNQSIQDNRETASIRLVTLDISQLENNTSGLSPTYKSSAFNGIVYIYDSSNTPSTRRGVRILNGTKIPSMGLTIASGNPIYIQGNFNTGGNPASNGSPGDPTNPQVSGYTRAPCSILADAVNILSGSWNDANSSAGTSSRVASNTTVNTAILGGIIPTAAPGGDGSYSGGAENFPRFLEDWSHAVFTYYGSMVELYNSKQSIGEWGKPNVYVPPTRRWYFDSNFKVKPPPGTLMVYSYMKGQWALQ
ncbi:MAG TPA: hypothetical protein VG103_03600 [Chthoniobacterales bacterium]|jgi:hypothetical protein|nr:hypothetical protein [Chthoniobacterales bacterium]